MKFHCWFLGISNDYTCLVHDANITEKDHVIKEIDGYHQERKSHKDVEKVWFVNTKMNYFPRGLEKLFPNFTYLHIKGNGMMEISKNDLKGLEGLVRLQIENCKLTSLPDDLFTEMPNLQEVSFLDNKIEFASSEVLKPLNEIENVRVDLRGNKNISAWFWPGFPNSLESLEELMKLIDEKCSKTTLPKVADLGNLNPKLKKMWLSGKYTDLKIIAGDKEFKVHKAVLGMENEVFAQIFEDQDGATEIKIPDFSSEAVEALLKFIYTNEVSEGNVKENFDIAEKFKVEAMKSFYEKVICHQLNDENALETFLFAHRLSSQLIKEKAFKMIINKIPDEVPNELMEDPENLKKLLEYRRNYEEILSKPKKMRLA